MKNLGFDIDPDLVEKLFREEIKISKETVDGAEELLKYLASESFGGSRGARDLRNAIRHKVEDKIAGAMVDSIDEEITVVNVTFDGVTCI